MKTLITISSAVLGAVLAPQNPTPQPTPRGLIKVVPQDATKGRAQTPQLNTAQSLDAWREQLTDTDLAKREQAFERLVASARHDRELARAIRDWSADTKSLEFAWTARMALRELKTQPFDMFAIQGLDLHGLNLPDLNFQGLQLPGFDPAVPFDPNDFLMRLGPNWPDLDSGANGGLGAPGSSSCESFSLNIGPDGVKCTVKREIDGLETTEEYDAESLDKLLEAHPELSDKLRGGADPFLSQNDGQSSGLLRISPFGLNRGSANGSAPQVGDPGEALELTPLPTEILGVIVQPLSESESKQLDLDAGVGLRIERVYDGTIARTMGLLRGQVLIEMNGRALESRDDITEELKKRGSDGQVECVVIDRWGQRRTHTWKPDPGRQL